MYIQSNYITTQLQLPLNLELTFKVTDEVITFNNLIDGLNLKKYLTRNTFDPRGRKNKRELILKAILFAYSIHIRSTREISSLCKYDTRFMYLTNGLTPSHTTINNVINSLSNNIDNLLLDINQEIMKSDNINENVVYIDGTKIEAYANKYTFVWKKSIIKFKAKLNDKIKASITDVNHYFEINGYSSLPVKDEYTSKELNDIFINLGSIITTNNIVCAYGKGKRKTNVQRLFDDFEEYASKMKEYEGHLRIIGNHRNSYSKTDNDATFMRMKDDHMMNGQLKAGYNVQIAVSDEYIMAIDLYQDRADFETFIPFIEKYYDMYGHYPQIPVADAGYGNFDNYKYCEENKMGLYQKYTMYAKEKEKKYKNNLFNKLNFKKDKEDNYICPNKKLVFVGNRRMKNTYSTQYEQQYLCFECDGCKYKDSCTTSNKGRMIIMNEEYDRLKEIVRNNLDSDEGINLRINRSIQVEGTFGVMKEDMRYKRFTRRGIDKALLEISLVAIGMNIQKYHNRLYRVLQ